MENHNLRLPVLISIIALLLSVIFSFVVFPILQPGLNLNLDPDKIGDLSYNIFSGKGYYYSDSKNPAIDRGPIYPYLCALIYWIAGESNPQAIQIVQAFIFAFTTFLIFWIVNTTVNYRSAIAAQILSSVHPMLIWYTARIWIETTHTFLLVLTALLLVYLYKQLNYRFTFLVGISLGLTILTKSIMILFPFLMLIPFYKKWKFKGIKHVLIFLFISYLCVLPWTLRNYSISKEFVPVHTSLGLNLIQGEALSENWINQPLSNMGTWHIGDRKMQEILTGTETTPQDAKGDKILTRHFFKNIYNEPVKIFKHFFINFLSFWYLNESPIKSIFLAIIQFPMVILFIISYKKIVHNYNNLLPLVWIVIYFVLLHSFIIGWGRYSVPIVPIMNATVIVYIMNFLIGKRVVQRSE